MSNREAVPSDQDAPMAAFIREESATGDILHVVGEVDLANVAEFETAAKALADQPIVLVDLTACTYMDSSGLRALAIVHKEAGNKLRVVVPRGGSVHRIFEITGLAEQFNACDSIEEALAKPPGHISR
ncbi:MAG: STAS domain-containing protein [Candidatus Eremiobacteraeota bacterium]|nr:STAS domain-containing protein [Candidatus Eremiobacteraeota bacterium]MBV8284127.1 STAS domain-containing protein [Candidatus Eremiobacteraeota bacterium]MBV8433290.1 STAS domain-containing protein [Candidatus Eremiobacteraeota bacterium]MBV8654490.1 STAS domain-containing protein [Candidatus Eremiobacteraeota bacterium]